MTPREQRRRSVATGTGRGGAPPLPRREEGAGLKPARRFALALGNAVSVAGAAAFVGSAGIMIALWFHLVMSWLGPAGIPVALLTAPTGALYPFVHWVVTGSFPAVYFALWVIGLSGMVVSMAWAASLRQRVVPTVPSNPEGKGP